MNDYERIARVIRYLDESHADQPNLTTLARCVGLSQHHFHRLFTSWAGITPKDFLQCLTLAHAQEILRQGKSVLDATLDVGLSSPGRLHDLCVSLEAASPGEVKSGGEGWTITIGFADSPFGKCLVGESHRGICHLSFVESSDKVALDTLKAQWPRARLQWDDTAASQLANRIFHRTTVGSSSAPLRAFVRGTPFQVRVWRALLQVQRGTLVSYGGLAAAVNQPTAARAVGSAVGQNSLAYLIPCHRVIRETGVLGDYRWGQVRKQAILAWENAPRFAAKSKHSD
ncbi:MAG TPA: methylated-DNA--[protein]-cysteine S-methyltransferase [Verrucomicrobiae bacterium]|jgi:AraC family transcriptional regulator of adaptative response/methylated-DNA-[protein]-cysteine methyltransferase|nr:methylated-DNA--[protein]-cysteine S-methyltransferase [Verrucomicrobiae bacterium]